MIWDSRKEANDYLIKANAIHPEEGFTKEEKAGMAGRQDLFYECYVNSFDKTKLIEFLETTISGNVKVPEEIEEQEAYKESFIDTAQFVKGDLERRNKA
jgi:hypothetical protein